jgi:hypothetical protein
MNPVVKNEWISIYAADLTCKNNSHASSIKTCQCFG